MKNKAKKEASKKMNTLGASGGTVSVGNSNMGGFLLYGFIHCILKSWTCWYVL